MGNLTDMYERKYQAYFESPREDLIQLIEGTNLRVLDIGCGVGATGKRLLETGKARWVSGVEFIAEKAEAARRVLSEVLTGDLAKMEFPWQPNSFDCIIAGDVLEHLVNPWELLSRLRSLISSGGVLVVSMPNVRHWWVVRDLVLRGEWRYQEAGVQDETHLRFFTRRSTMRLLNETGYQVKSVHPFLWGPKTRTVSRLTFGMANEFLAERWLFAAGVKSQIN
jgi:2-polyprenyl-3-methyl-5-hydroxy-6-metoxy-1,4-benzoquinol methylase